LGYAAERVGIKLVAFIANSNHYHAVVVDVEGRLPACLERFHKLLAKHQNCLRGRWENLWSSEHSSVIELIGAEDVLAKTVYTLSNPVKDHLVERTHHWPRIRPADETRGIDFLLELAGGQRMKVCVRGAILLDPPRRTRDPPACGPVSVEIMPDGSNLPSRLRSDRLRWPRRWPPARYEASVGPGDLVEVCGLIHHEHSLDATGAFDRHIAVEPVLRAGVSTPLLVRILDRV